MVAHILSVQPSGRFALGGFCQNALLAYEVARQLQAHGLALPLLVMIDPGDSFGTLKPKGLMATVPRRVEREWFHLKAMLRLAPAGWFGYVRRRYAGVRFELEGRRWQRVALRGSAKPEQIPELAQALFASRVDYAPLPYPGPVLFIEPTERPDSNEQRAEGWRALVEHSQWVSVVGDHLGLFVAPAVEHLARAIRKALDEQS